MLEQVQQASSTGKARCSSFRCTLRLTFYLYKYYESRSSDDTETDTQQLVESRTGTAGK